MRLIDAEKLLEELGKHFNKAGGKTIYHPSMELAMLDVKAAPTVDASPVVHGLWEKTSKYMPIYCCSVCKERNLFRNGDNVFSNYCPNCGAKMDG